MEKINWIPGVPEKDGEYFVTMDISNLSEKIKQDLEILSELEIFVDMVRFENGKCKDFPDEYNDELINALKAYCDVDSVDFEIKYDPDNEEWKSMNDLPEKSGMYFLALTNDCFGRFDFTILPCFYIVSKHTWAPDFIDPDDENMIKMFKESMVAWKEMPEPYNVNTIYQ